MNYFVNIRPAWRVRGGKWRSGRGDRRRKRWSWNLNDYYLNVAVWNWFKYLEIFTILDRYIGIISLSITKYNKSKSDEHQSESDRLCFCGQINRRFCRFRSAGQSSMIPVNLLAAGRTTIPDGGGGGCGQPHWRSAFTLTRPRLTAPRPSYQESFGQCVLCPSTH